MFLDIKVLLIFILLNLFMIIVGFSDFFNDLVSKWFKIVVLLLFKNLFIIIIFICDFFFIFYMNRIF